MTKEEFDNKITNTVFTAMYRMFNFGESDNRMSAQCEVQGLLIFLEKELVK